MNTFGSLSGKISNVSISLAPLVIASCGLTFSCGTEKDAGKPNILFILSDDHSVEAISAYGPSLIKTPNIDRIAAIGTRFANCFVVVSLCAPSRAAILTGKYSAVNGVLRINDALDSTQVTFPKILHDAGYQTAIFGKWHLRSKPIGFDNYNVVFDQGLYYNSPFKSSEEEWIEGPGKNIIPGYFTDILTDMSIQWLEDRDKSKPFCLLVHHKAPHHPWIYYPDQYDSLFADKDLPEPETFNDDFEGKNQYLVKEPCRFSKIAYTHPGHFEKIPEGLILGSEEFKTWAYQKNFKGYYRLISHMDDNIGRLLDYLRETGLDNNTIIIYMSDNGFFLGDHGLYNKQWMYEESIRIPLIISLPGEEKKERVIDEMVSSLDLASTILDYARLEIPADFQGKSLKPLIEGEVPDSWRNAHFYHYFDQWEVPENYGLRTEKFKLFNVVYSDTSDWEFYDLINDPDEMKNQINNPAFKQTIDSLRRELFDAKNTFETTPVVSK